MKHNYVAKHNKHRAKVHRDKKNDYHRADEKLEIDDHIQEFVDGLYEDGYTPKDKFGITKEDFDEMYTCVFTVDQEAYALLREYHLMADLLTNYECAQRFRDIKQYLKEKGHTSQEINRMNIQVLDEIERLK